MTRQREQGPQSEAEPARRAAEHLGLIEGHPRCDSCRECRTARETLFGHIRRIAGEGAEPIAIAVFRDLVETTCDVAPTWPNMDALDKQIARKVKVRRVVGAEVGEVSNIAELIERVVIPLAYRISSSRGKDARGSRRAPGTLEAVLETVEPGAPPASRDKLDHLIRAADIIIEEGLHEDLARAAREHLVQLREGTRRYRRRSTPEYLKHEVLPRIAEKHHAYFPALIGERPISTPEEARGAERLCGALEAELSARSAAEDRMGVRGRDENHRRDAAAFLRQRRDDLARLGDLRSPGDDAEEGNKP